ncbi:MAG TPA: hypothetical protein PKW82_01850 [Spirochaetales bacterium]|nr:hypothetical protein [Spirochaetales bacterium]
MKRVVTFILVAACAVAVFMVGWVSFRLEPGAWGVVRTKTGGVEETAIESGSFAWRWEALLPTNLSLAEFALSPRELRVASEGELPSAAAYSAFAPGKPDFSYGLEATLRATIRSSALPGLVASGAAPDQAGLDASFGLLLERAKQSLASALVARAGEREFAEALPSGERSAIEALAADVEAAVPELEVLSLTIDAVRLPDLDLYRYVRDAYRSWLDATLAATEALLADDAAFRARDELALERLERYGELLERYPVLVDFLAIEAGADPDLLDVLGTRAGRVPDAE